MSNFQSETRSLFANSPVLDSLTVSGEAQTRNVSAYSSLTFSIPAVWVPHILFLNFSVDLENYIGLY